MHPLRTPAFSAFALGMLGLLVVVTPPGSAEEERLRLDRPASFGGVIQLSRGERDLFTVLVTRHLRGDLFEILAEEERDPGQFRVEYPGVEGGPSLIILSPRHVPIVRGAPDGGRTYWERRAIRPKPWQTVTIQLRDRSSLAAARVHSLSAAPFLARHLPAALLLTEHIAGPDGSVSVPGVDGFPLLARVETREVRTPFVLLHPARPSGAIPWSVYPRGRTVRITAWRYREDLVPFEMFGDQLTVSARTKDGWEEVARKGGMKPAFEGRLPHGTSAVKVEAEGLRPWIRDGLDPRDTADLDLFTVLRVDVLRSSSRLTVRTTADDRAVIPEPEVFRACGGAVGGPLRRTGPAFRAEVRRSGAGEFAPMDAERDHVPDSVTREPTRPELPFPPCGREVLVNRPGPHEVRVRGDLGAARARTVDVPADADVEIAVDLSNVGGIRIVAAESRTLAASTVSFRLEREDGTPVAAEYTDGMFNRPPYWSFMGPEFTDVPNGGILRVDPGAYRVVFRKDGEDAAACTLKVRPDTVRRIDTRFAQPDEDPTRRRIR